MKTALNRKSAVLVTMMAAVLSLPVQASGFDDIDDYDEPEKIVNSSSEETTGTGTGMVIGGLMAGPAGILVGGITGNYIGRKKNTEKKLDLAQKEITTLRAQLETNRRLLATREATSADKTGAMLVSRKAISLNTGADHTLLIRKGFNLSVQFRTDSYFLEAHDKKRMVTLAASLKKIPELKVYLQGYTDQRGSEAHNKQLSQRRINTVYHALIKSGVPASRIRMQAWGESRLLSKRLDVESMNFDRRVVISFSKKGE